ncbi:hypothetical protein Vadar_022951 [Vaccinium darrowii]|uniref:Uncharacterized protein n=1 Tax=Vaccinium darrowii TaxID=229202 RepID=A0ACB7Y9T0_9ERIC|nr:hypothetical protein Vadar_022951 [Vaccinium darrowii]
MDFSSGESSLSREKRPRRGCHHPSTRLWNKIKGFHREKRAVVGGNKALSPKQSKHMLPFYTLVEYLQLRVFDLSFTVIGSPLSSTKPHRQPLNLVDELFVWSSFECVLVSIKRVILGYEDCICMDMKIAADFVFDIESLVEKLLHQLARKQTISVNVYDTTNSSYPISMYGSTFGGLFGNHEMRYRYNIKGVCNRCFWG